MTNKIDKLTKKQEQQLVEFREEWRKIGLATGKANIPAIRDAIAAEYREIGKELKQIIRCPSPRYANLLINKLEHAKSVQKEIAGSCKKVGVGMWDAKKLHESKGTDFTYVPTYFWGSLDAYWIAFYEFPHLYIKKIYTDAQWERLLRYDVIARNAFWWYPFEEACFVCDRPSQINVDERFRLHSFSNPAIEFTDGWKLYYIHGVQVRDYVVENPNLITPAKISKQANVEVRRIMLDLYGWDRYLVATKTKPIHQDEFGTLYHRHINEDEDLVMVRVKDATTDREYFLRVPPTIQTAKEAVAWTFEQDAKDYQPTIET